MPLLIGRDVELCGWRLRSALPLPGLPPWRGSRRAVDLFVSFGPAPDHLPDPAGVTPIIEIGRDGTSLIRLDRIARILVRGGREVVITPAISATEDDLRCVLFGLVLATLCHQRGLIPLHAACVLIGGRAVALVGISAAGKSALTAALAARGHEVLADDLLVIDPAGPVILPAEPGLKLWPDVLDALHLKPDLPRLRPGLDKHLLLQTTRRATDGLSLSRIYLLERSMSETPDRFEVLPTWEAARLLALHMHGRRVAQIMGRNPMPEAAIERLADAVSVQRYQRRFDLSRLDDQARAIEVALLGSDGGR